MTGLTGLDLALNVVENADGRLLSTDEEGEVIVHSLKVMGVQGVVLLAGPSEPGDARHCWLGCQVGRFPVKGRLVDALAADTSVTHRLDGELDGDQVNLRLRTVVDPRELSVAAVRRIATENASLAARVSREIRAESDVVEDTADEPGPEIGPPPFGDLVKTAAAAVRRVLRHGGHRTTPGPATDGPWFRQRELIGSVTATRSGWLHLATQPSVLPPTDDLRELAEWLEGSSPPDTLALCAGDHIVRVVGAAGAVAFAIEDTLDLRRAVARALSHDVPDTLLDLLGGWVTVARKVQSVVEPGSRPDVGWQRPVTVMASSRTGEAEVRVRDPLTGNLVTHPGLTHAVADLARGEHGDGLRAELDRLLMEWFQDPRHVWNR